MAVDNYRLLMIGSYYLPYPSKFQMKKVPNIVAEIRTMTGRDIADVAGWKYANTTISWGAMLPEDLDNLVLATRKNSPATTITFEDANRLRVTKNAIVRGLSYSKVNYAHDGQIMFEDVTLELSFPGVEDV